MTTTSWRWLRFEHGADPEATHWKAHGCPASLQRLLLADLGARGAQPLITPDYYGGAVQPLREYLLDPGGPVFSDIPKLVVKLSGLQVSTNVDNVEWMLATLRRAPLRRFGDAANYIKLHGHYHCLVMRPDHRDALIAKLVQGRNDAKARAQAFYVERQASMQKAAPRAKRTLEMVIGPRVDAALPRGPRGQA